MDRLLIRRGSCGKSSLVAKGTSKNCSRFDRMSASVRMPELAMYCSMGVVPTGPMEDRSFSQLSFEIFPLSIKNEMNGFSMIHVLNHSSMEIYGQSPWSSAQADKSDPKIVEIILAHCALLCKNDDIFERREEYFTENSKKDLSISIQVWSS